MVSPRENLLRVFRHEVPDWIPIVGHVDPYDQPSRQGMDPALDEALGTITWGDESTVAFSRYLGLDIMDWLLAPPYRSKRNRVAVEKNRDGAETVTIWHTPRGDLREVSRQIREDGTSYAVEHFLKGPDDLAALACSFEDEEFEFDQDRMAELTRRRELIGEDGVSAFPMPGTPLGMLVRVYAGVETTAYLHHDAPEALRDLLATMEENYVRQFRLAAPLDRDALIGIDDTSTTAISPAMFEAYCMGYTDRVSDVVHESGKLYLHHSCGMIRDLLDLYKQTKMDGVHALTVPPVGDVTVMEAKGKLGPDILIWATLTSPFAVVNDWDELKGIVRQMFEGAAAGDNIIFGLAATPNKTMDETRRLLDECRRYQLIRHRG